MTNDTGVIKHIVIVGGGTAGWLAANHLAKQLKPQTSGLRITLIESPDIPTVGVGEGTVPNMRNTLKYFGIRETDFIRQCDVTFKQSIKFVDWLHSPGTVTKNYYHHIFNYPEFNQFDLSPYWLKGLAGENCSYAEAVSMQAHLCDLGKAPKSMTDPEFAGHASYAYHLDAGKFSQMLQRNATEELGVEHLFANVVAVEDDNDGFISTLLTDRTEPIKADFFVDCTGFSAQLLGRHLGVEFVDKSDILFADNALVMQVPYPHEQADIAGYTIATAQDAGWIWDIGLTSRRGVGYVYSSHYTSQAEAEARLRQYVGKQHDNISCRNIAMQIGYRQKFWHKNCAAIGLSQGFVEPLEATGLIVFDATSRMLADLMPTSRHQLALAESQFNQQVGYAWDSVIDFVKLHYCLTQRNDSAFWRDNQRPESIPASLQAKLARWQHRLPNDYDFPSRFDIFNLDNYRYVLFGMGYQPDNRALALRYDLDQQAQTIFAQIAEYGRDKSAACLSNREIICRIQQFGLQRV